MFRDNALKSYETNTLLEFFLHYMDQEQRRRLMVEFSPPSTASYSRM